ncbi:hypothetical protein DFQ30_006237 [Apophysomyces sp. BC1015]|nr:hypothetical protein DFQ30_006237 [Apophysomyces sp. BC1015]KAG0177146.1 hypothetical protein DFQ29_005184 [Apophysomyces sp. BC1021]
MGTPKKRKKSTEAEDDDFQQLIAVRRPTRSGASSVKPNKGKEKAFISQEDSAQSEHTTPMKDIEDIFIPGTSQLCTAVGVKLLLMRYAFFSSGELIPVFPVCLWQRAVLATLLIESVRQVRRNIIQYAATNRATKKRNIYGAKEPETKATIDQIPSLKTADLQTMITSMSYILLHYDAIADYYSRDFR